MNNSNQDQPKVATRWVQRPAMSPFKRSIVALLVFLLVGSASARIWLNSNGGESNSGASSIQSGSSGGTPIGGSALAPQGLVAGGGKSNGALSFPSADQAQTPEDAGIFEKSLPYFTEGSFFALVGFALGYATRRLMKVGLIVIAIFFVVLQGLGFSGVISVDWSRAVELINNFVLNLQENQTLTSVLTDRIPSVGSLVAGYFLGMRRG